MKGQDEGPVPKAGMASGEKIPPKQGGNSSGQAFAMDEVLVFWPLEAKTELTPSEAPEEQQGLGAAPVNSLSHWSLVASLHPTMASVLLSTDTLV